MGFMFVIYKFSKITLCPGYKFDIFALFDFCLARQHILISDFFVRIIGTYFSFMCEKLVPIHLTCV